MRKLTIAAALAAACGTSMNGEPATIQATRALSSEMSAVVQAYGTDMAAVASPAACEATHAGYAAHMADLEHRMGELSSDMDSHMAEWGHGAGMADMSCVSDAMAAELAEHHLAACASDDLAADRAEAAHHVEIMAALLEHQRVRAGEAGSGLGMGMMDPGHDTFACQHGGDGSFSFDGEPWQPGAPVP
jgi:hypothetical protein